MQLGFHDSIELSEQALSTKIIKLTLTPYLRLTSKGEFTVISYYNAFCMQRCPRFLVGM